MSRIWSMNKKIVLYSGGARTPPNQHLYQMLLLGQSDAKYFHCLGRGVVNLAYFLLFWFPFSWAISFGSKERDIPLAFRKSSKITIILQLVWALCNFHQTILGDVKFEWQAVGIWSLSSRSGSRDLSWSCRCHQVSFLFD